MMSRLAKMDHLKTDYRFSMYRQQQPRRSAKRLRKSSGKTQFPSYEYPKEWEYRFGIYKKLPGIKANGYRYGYQRLNSESEQLAVGPVSYGRQQYKNGAYGVEEGFTGHDQSAESRCSEDGNRQKSYDSDRVGQDKDPDTCQTKSGEHVSRHKDHFNESKEGKHHYFNGIYGEIEESFDGDDDGYGDDDGISMSIRKVAEGNRIKKTKARVMSYEWDIGGGGHTTRSRKFKRLNDLDEIKDYGSKRRKKKKEKHIVAGIDIGPDPPLMYKKYIWGRKTRPHNHGNLEMSADLQGYRYRGYASNNAFHPGRYYRANGSLPHRRWPGAFGTASKNAYLSSDNVSMKPKVVTIVRQGNRPRNSVKILLNRRSVQSFEQLMADISEAFGPKWKNDKVRKLYTIKGREVQGISDFFRQDDLFVACSNETINEEDIRDILHEMYPDSHYAKKHHRDHERPRKKRHHPVHREIEADKRDSGFGEASEGSNSNRESDHEVTQQSHGQGRHEEKKRRDRRDKEKRSLSPAKDSPRQVPEESPRETARDPFGRTDRGPYDERERARRRQQKMMESEKRALEDERRKRGLVPLKGQEDPFKRMKDREKEKLELRRRKEQEKKRQLEEEEKEKRKKELEEAERAARARKEAFEKQEREREERERAEREKEEKEKAEREKEELEKNKEKDQDKDKGNDKVVEKADKEKVKDTTKKRQKTKIVRRTKAERQIPNDDPVLSKYDLGRTLGDGNFAIVRTSKLKANGQEFAMKVIDKPKLKGKEHMVENEIEIMKDCSHHNIVKLYEEYETPDKLYLVMELVKGGDLFDAITQSVKFGEVDSANMVKDLCHALFYLHSRNIVHRDLKPENLLVHRNKDGTITLKLADFGLAMEVKELIYTVCGTPTYVAPEILSEIGYGLEVDMWAVGVISYILLCGFPPFRSPDRNQTELFEFIKAGAYEFLSPYWDYISNAAKDMIQHLLVVEKKRRYTAIEVLSHPWIVGGGDMSLLMDTARIDEARRERRKELDMQAKQNLESYTRMKEKRRAKEE